MNTFLPMADSRGDSLHLWVKGGLKLWTHQRKFRCQLDSLHLWVKGGLKPINNQFLKYNGTDSLHLWVKGGLKH